MKGYAMGRLSKEDILDLSISERIQLVEDIWDSIACVPESIQLSGEHKVELERRLDAYHATPTKDPPGKPSGNGSGAGGDV